MNQGKIVNAYKALCGLTQEKMPMRTAYQLYRLRSKLESAWTFQRQEEEKLLREHNGELTREGYAKFNTFEDKRDFEAQMQELMDMETDIEIEPVEMKLADNITISANDIEALDGIVHFLE